MSRTLFAVVFSLVILAGAVAVAGEQDDDQGIPVYTKKDCRLGNHRVELAGKNVILTALDNDDFEVEITKDYEVYVDGRRVKLDSTQEELVRAYYDHFFGMVREVKEVGWEGARIGLQGAGIGIKAIAGILKMVLTSYDEDDLERDMEEASEKIEARANDLEERAEGIEDMAHELEDLFDDMVGGIPDLKKLEW